MKRLFRNPLVLLLLIVLVLLSVQYGFSLFISLLIIAGGYGLLFWLYKHYKLSPSDIGLGRDAMKVGVRVSLAMIFIIFVGSYLVYTLTPDIFLDERYNQTFGKALVAALIILPIRTVIFEELLFRGFLWGLFAKQKSETFATIVSSLLFGLWHILPSRNIGSKVFTGVDITLSEPLVIGGIVIATFLAGVVFSELRRRTKSLLPPIAVHWAINAAGIIFASLAWN